MSEKCYEYELSVPTCCAMEGAQLSFLKSESVLIGAFVSKYDIISSSCEIPNFLT